MPSIAPGVFELKDSDESTWYRLIYLARVKDTLHVLHCFEKNTAKTENGISARPSDGGNRCNSNCERSRNMKRTPSEAKAPHLTKGSVLDDLGFSPSEALEIKVKAELYRDLLGYIRERGFTQGQLGTALGIHQPDVSNLLTGKVSKFSVGKLIQFAGKLNLRAQVRLTRPRAGKRPSVSASGKTQKKELAIA